VGSAIEVYWALEGTELSIKCASCNSEFDTRMSGHSNKNFKKEITIKRKRFKGQFRKILGREGGDKICFHNFFIKTQFHKHTYRGF
jgi:hypothetical protein